MWFCLSARLYSKVALPPVHVKLCGQPQNCHAQQELRGVPTPRMFCLIFKQSNGSISCAISAGAQFDSHWTAEEKKQKKKKNSWEVPHLQRSRRSACAKNLTSIIQLCFDIFRTSYQALSLCHCLSHLVSHSISYLTLMLYFNAFNLSLYRSHSLALSLYSTLTQLTLSLTHSLSLALSPYYLTPQLTLSLTLLYLVSFLHLVFFTICVYCIYKQLCRLIIIPLSYLCIYVYKNVNHKKKSQKNNYILYCLCKWKKNSHMSLTLKTKGFIEFYFCRNSP